MYVGGGAILQLDGLEGARLITFCKRKPVKPKVKELLSMRNSLPWAITASEICDALAAAAPAAKE